MASGVIFSSFLFPLGSATARPMYDRKVNRKGIRRKAPGPGPILFTAVSSCNGRIAPALLCLINFFFKTNDTINTTVTAVRHEIDRVITCLRRCKVQLSLAPHSPKYRRIRKKEGGLHYIEYLSGGAISEKISCVSSCRK